MADSSSQTRDTRFKSLMDPMLSDPVEVFPQLYVGSWQSTKNQQWVQTKGVSRVLVLGAGSDVVVNPPCISKELPCDDSVLPSLFEGSVALLQEALGQGLQALIVCRDGQTYSPVIAVAFLVAAGWTLQASVERLRSLLGGNVISAAQYELCGRWEEQLTRMAKMNAAAAAMGTPPPAPVPMALPQRQVASPPPTTATTPTPQPAPVLDMAMPAPGNPSYPRPTRDTTPKFPIPTVTAAIPATITSAATVSASDIEAARVAVAESQAQSLLSAPSAAAALRAKSPQAPNHLFTPMPSNHAYSGVHPVCQVQQTQPVMSVSVKAATAAGLAGQPYLQNLTSPPPTNPDDVPKNPIVYQIDQIIRRHSLLDPNQSIYNQPTSTLPPVQPILTQQPQPQVQPLGPQIPIQFPQAPTQTIPPPPSSPLPKELVTFQGTLPQMQTPQLISPFTSSYLPNLYRFGATVLPSGIYQASLGGGVTMAPTFAAAPTTAGVLPPPTSTLYAPQPFLYPGQRPPVSYFGGYAAAPSALPTLTSSGPTFKPGASYIVVPPELKQPLPGGSAAVCKEAQLPPGYRATTVTPKIEVEYRSYQPQPQPVPQPTVAYNPYQAMPTYAPVKRFF